MAFNGLIQIVWLQDGRTPLLLAIQAARESIVKLLVENGAKVNLTDSAHK